MTRHTDDGLGERLVSTEVFPLVVDETERPEPEWEPCSFEDFEVDPEKYPLLASSCGYNAPQASVSYPIGGGWAGGGEVVGDQLLFSLGGSLAPSTRVTLVDPVAERALLGAAGDFLAPLEELSEGGPAPPATIATWFYVGAIAIELRDVSLPVAAGAAGVLTVILVLTSWREKR